MTPADRARLAALQTEVDAAYLYARIAEAEADSLVASTFAQLAEIEKGHALKALEQLPGQSLPGPSTRAKILNRIGKMFGYDYIIGVMMDVEKSISLATTQKKMSEQLPLAGSENNHVKILQSLIQNKTSVPGEKLSRIEGRHRTVGGNALRAAVLGANDGLVSNMSLVMGVAGATQGERGVLLAGIAGLMAGAISMSLGEWISVKSSQELYERQMAQEMEEIETDPEGERRELALIYRAKGIPEEQAMTMAARDMENKTQAHEILVKEELGINADELKGSAWEAAYSSFILFAIGAIIPVIPFFWLTGTKAIAWSLGGSTIGLFLIGAVITLFTGTNLWRSGFRQVLFGLAAAAVTFAIGRLVGVSIG